MPRVVKPAAVSGVVSVLLVAAISPLVAGIRAAPRTVVGTPAPPMLTDFVAAAEQAYWRNDAGERLPFPGSESDARGFALVRSAKLEDGNDYAGVLQTHPRWAGEGRIEGSYHITLAANQRSRAKVGFVTGAQGTDGVRCRVIWHSEGEGHTVAEITKSYDGRLADVSADLAPYGGQQGDLILWVYAGASSGKDWIAWVNPRLEPAPSHPVVQSIPVLQARYDDPSERWVPDGRDFKALDVTCDSDGLLRVALEFQTARAAKQFKVFAAPDANSEPSATVRCDATSFAVLQRGATGSTYVSWSGEPRLERARYEFTLPRSHCGSRESITLWAESPEGGDRLPDSGRLQLSFADCAFALLSTGENGDHDGDTLLDSYEEELLRRFRPYYRFSKKDGKQEKYRPADALTQIRYAQLKSDHYWPGKTGVHTIETCGSSPDHHLDPPSQLLTCAEGTDLRITRSKGGYALNINDDHYGGDPWDNRRAYGMYGHVVPHGDFVKIEYWQYFAYNQQDAVAATHEGDWCYVHVWYDPISDDLVKTCHYAHGAKIPFDLRKGTAPSRHGTNIILQYRGPNYDATPGDLNTAGGKYRNNEVQFYIDSDGNKHVVCYVERNGHEFWASEHGWWPGVNEHNGNGGSYLTPYDPHYPLDLGEVEHPLAEDAAIILCYSGYWGYWHHAGNKPPHGPSLHAAWTWPESSAIAAEVIANGVESSGEGPPER